MSPTMGDLVRDLTERVFAAFSANLENVLRGIVLAHNLDARDCEMILDADGWREFRHGGKALVRWREPDVVQGATRPNSYTVVWRIQPCPVQGGSRAR